ILHASLSSELHVLAHKLDHISEQQRWSRDFTFNSLLRALTEVIACFPVYRTYLRPHADSLSALDRAHVLRAVAEAKRRNPTVSRSIFEFLAELLVLSRPQTTTEQAFAERKDFVLRLQQLTGPVMAKGLEDTTFYRYFPLSSLNEVGGEPLPFGRTL